MLGRVLVHRRQKLFSAPESLGNLRQVGIIGKVGPLDHEQEILKLLGAVRGNDEVAVPCWFNGWNFDRPSGPCDPWPSGKRREHGRVRDHGDRHAVEHCHIDELTDAAPDGLSVCGDCPERGVGTRRPFTETTTRRERGQVRESTLSDGSAGSLQGEFGAGAI